jgi:hypothetical protein
MDLNDETNLDPVYEEIVVLLNARPEEVSFRDPAFVGKGLSLHAVQQVSADELVRSSKFDPATGTFTVAGRTTVVFNHLREPVTAPTPTPMATEAIPALADPTILLTLAGVIGAFFAVLAMILALRKKETK